MISHIYLQGERTVTVTHFSVVPAVIIGINASLEWNTKNAILFIIVPFTRKCEGAIKCSSYIQSIEVIETL